MYDSPAHARDCIAVFRTRYNEYRPHWALVHAEGGDPLTPHDVYVSGCATKIPKWQGWAIGAKRRLDALMREHLIDKVPVSEVCDMGQPVLEEVVLVGDPLAAGADA